MIVPMKKVTLLALASEESAALIALRNLGVMQVVTVKSAQSENSQSLEELHASAATVVNDLGKFFAEAEKEGRKFEAGGVARSGAETVELAARLLDNREKLRGNLDAVRQKLRHLAIWGDFNRDTIEELRAKGIYVYLCAGRESAVEAAQALDDAETRVIDTEAGRIYFAVISTREIPPDTLPEIRLTAEDNPPALRNRQVELEYDLKVVETELEQLNASLPAARHRVEVLASELEFSRANDSFSDHGAVVSLQGFVPVPALKALQSAAEANGWGLMIEDPGPDDRVPTLIKTSRVVRLIEPLFKFLGIDPGYDEIDVSAGVLIFFTIFYAMIVGDAGYGMIFLIGALLAAVKFRNKPAARLPIALVVLLSAATIVWGIMTGNIFGRPNPEFLRWAEVPALASSPLKDANVQMVCFSLALVQLSMGRIWRILHEGTARSLIGNIGWIALIAANYILTLRLLVYPGPFPPYMIWLYVAGIVLVALCEINIKDVATIFQFPFSIINSFVDVLSYIRLFAVGLAGFYIASSFNDMGKNLYDIHPALMWLPAALVILFGHALNLGLCVMSVMVHGVRLNTLEFSSHVGLTWAGTKFKPFKNIKKLEEN